MPDPISSLEEGQRAEKLGVLDRTQAALRTGGNVPAPTSNVKNASSTPRARNRFSTS